MRFTKTLSPQKTLDIRGQNCYSYLVPFDIKYAGMVKLANTLDSGSSVARLAGSSPVTRTKNPVHASERDFYLLLLTSSLLPQPKTLRDFWEVISKK